MAPLLDEMVECGSPYLVVTDGQIYLLDDCAAMLVRLDPDTGHAECGWHFPNDGYSDVNVLATPTDEGIWMVDVEQTAEPDFFDPEARQFERLPIDRAAAAGIYGEPLWVHSGRTG